MIADYTVHLGPRSDPWPPQVATAATRGEAQRLASALLRQASPEITKAEVRLHHGLLDCYKRMANSTRHIYEARQRAQGDT